MSSWAGPYYGVDFGFAADPSAGVCVWIDDATTPPTAYVQHEFWQLGCEIDALPGALEAALPGISRHVAYCDSARPETVSHLQRHGIPNARSAEKWSGSIADGIAFLRSLRMVIHPRCRHLIDECGRYSFKTDRLTGVPLPEPIDAHNHCIDSLRYALGPLIRNQPSGSFFSRAALLVAGEPVETGDRFDRPRRVFATVAMSDRAGTGVGVVWFASNPHHSVPLRVLDYQLTEIDVAFAAPDWLVDVLARGAALAAELVALDPVARVFVEGGDLSEALRIVFEDRLTHQFTPQRPPYDLGRVEAAQLLSSDGTRPLMTLDERAADLRATVNAGQTVKLARGAYARQLTHRSVTANHLLNQLLGYRPGAKEAPQELVGAFLLGCLLARGGAVAAQQEAAVAAPESAAPLAPPPRATHDPANPPRTHLALHGTLPPAASDRPGGLRVR